MESPVFKLEKVVHSRSEEMQDFEGPLDLILFLLGKNKLEIQDISISLICDQYVAWLEQRQKMDLEVASEFVIMASHLVYLKTRMLLSIEDEEAKSEMDALLQSLEERRRSENYVRVKALARRLEPSLRIWCWPWRRSRAGRSGSCRRRGLLSGRSCSMSRTRWKARPARS